MKRGKHSNAEKVLKKIRKENEIEEELQEIEEDIVSSPVLGLRGTLREMCTKRVLVRLMGNISLCTVPWPYVLYKYYSVYVSTAGGVCGITCC